MGVSIELSDTAAAERARLPDTVRAALDAVLEELAGSPPTPGQRLAGFLDEVAPDGTYYHVEFDH